MRGTVAILAEYEPLYRDLLNETLRERMVAARERDFNAYASLTADANAIAVVMSHQFDLRDERTAA